jgi:hypothetical protein
MKATDAQGYGWRRRWGRPLLVAGQGRPPWSCSSSPSSLVSPLREVVRSLDANQPIYDVRTMDEFDRMRTVVTLNLVSGFIAAPRGIRSGAPSVGRQSHRSAAERIGFQNSDAPGLDSR